MIYFFYGSDAVQAKIKIKNLTQALLVKKPDALHFYFDDRSFDNEFVKGLFQSVGLFAQNHLVFLDRVFKLLESDEMIISMQESPHVFIIFENDLLKDKVEYIKDRSVKFIECGTNKIIKKENRSDIFQLTNAIGLRDKKRVWIIYQELIMDGMDVAGIYPMVFWQVKTMLAVSNAKNAKDAGVKPFVFTQTKRFVEHYGKTELQIFSRKLIKVLYDSRQGQDLGVELEKVLLNI